MAVVVVAVLEEDTVIQHYPHIDRHVLNEDSGLVNTIDLLYNHYCLHRHYSLKKIKLIASINQFSSIYHRLDTNLSLLLIHTVFHFHLLVKEYYLVYGLVFYQYDRSCF